MKLDSPFKDYDGEIVPRKEGEPPTDITPTLVDHRAMRTDYARVAEILNQNESFDPERAKALARYTRSVVMAALRHHQIEDDIMWGVLEACAGSQVDLTPFADDHDKLNLSIREAVRLLLIFESSGEFPVEELATVITEISEELDEHIGKEEETVWRIYVQYVSQSTEGASAQYIAEHYPKDEFVPFFTPWLLHHATPEEAETLKAIIGPGLPMVQAEIPGFLDLRAKALGQ